MIKTVTSAERFQYKQLKHLAARDEFVPKLLEWLIAISSLRHPPFEATIAAGFGYSQPHFRRLCLDAIGESVHSFVLRIRLERGAMSLTAGQSVASAARGAVFESREAFSRAFASHFACSPSGFQRLNENVPPDFPANSVAQRQSLRSVKVRTADSSYTRFLYDGVILLGRTFSDGRIDWRVNFRRDSRKAR